MAALHHHTTVKG